LLILLFSLTLLITLGFGMRYPAIRGIMLTAWAVRMLLLLIHHQIFVLLPGRGDARTFYLEALDFSQLGFAGALGEFTVTHSTGFSALMGAMLAMFGRAIMVMELLNISMGLAVVALVYRLALNCGADRSQAKRAALIMALVPSTAQYSVVALREMILVLPFMLGLVALTARRTHATVDGMILFSFWCGVAAMFHGGMILGIVGLGAGAFIFQMFASRLPGQPRPNIFMNLLLMALFAGLVSLTGNLVGEVGLNKVSDFSGGNLVDQINVATQSAARGGSGYLHDFSVDDYGDVALSVPLRLFYFFFSPLPWDIRSVGHVIGFLDVLLYAFCFREFWRAYKANALSPKVLMVLGVVMTIAMAYAFGSSNAGTAIRHRAKFSYALVAIACAARSARWQRNAVGSTVPPQARLVAQRYVNNQRRA
jgi:hypothetical protein